MPDTGLILFWRNVHPLYSIERYSLALVYFDSELKSDDEENSKCTEPHAAINTFILPLQPLNDRKDLRNIKYSTYPCLSKVKLVNFMKNTLVSMAHATPHKGFDRVVHMSLLG